jgi:hypothetical protein
VFWSMSALWGLAGIAGLLPAGAFAYQRLRPPPLPDLRTVHASQR